ncbi:MAG: PepSY-like domain-containing protein [Chitinophagaceae bacterium]|nr:PepSY-like domain-containing protein [Chitinophagaceae bacterium]
MKRLFVLSLFTLLTASVFAGGPTKVNEKVLRSFKATFTSAEQVKWYENDQSYTVRFFQGDVRYIVYYDAHGNITSSMRFYKPALLPTPILNALQHSYANKTAFGVTEITSGENTAYFIKAEDNRYWYSIRFNGTGESELYEKLKKQP